MVNFPREAYFHEPGWRAIYLKVANPNGYRRLSIEQTNWGSVGLTSFVVLSSLPSELATET
jgi:hypothetical protein